MSAATLSASELDERLRGLLGRCVAKDAKALHALYELASPILFSCLTRMLRRRSLAEEALQDVFVSVWERASQFQPERGRPMAWLVSIARYRAIDLLRHERLAPVTTDALPESAAAVEPDEEPALWSTPTSLLERCLKLLSTQQRECLELAFVGGKSHADVALQIGSPLGSVKSWIRRGLQTLRTCLES